MIGLTASARAKLKGPRSPKRPLLARDRHVRSFHGAHVRIVGRVFPWSSTWTWSWTIIEESITLTTTITLTKELRNLIDVHPVFTGRLPFLAKNVFDILSMHANVAPESPLTYNPMLPEAVADVILRAIEKDRGNRYQSASELKEALASAVPETGRWQSFSTGVFKAPPTNEHPKVVLSRSLLGTAAALGPTEAAGETQVAPRVAVAPPTATGLSGFYGESQLQLTRRRRKQWIGASVVAAAIVAVGSFLALKGDDRAANIAPAAAPDPATAPEPATAPASATAPVTAPASEEQDSPPRRRERRAGSQRESATAPASAFRPHFSSSSDLRALRASVVTPLLSSARVRATAAASPRARTEKARRDTEPATLSVGVVEGDEPSSGVLLVNGKRHGEVPGSFQLAPGKYRLLIEKKGYRSFSRKVKLKGGEEKNITFKVEPVEQ